MPASSISRRGSIYVAVLGVSTLVLVIGLGAVMVGRVKARTAITASDFAEARVCARSGLELAMHAVYNDPYWRQNRGNGPWFTNRPIGTGAFNVAATDPIDNDVTIGDNNPVVLTCIGTKGAARYALSMRMEVGAKTGSCLEASLCCAEDLTLTGATLSGDQTVRSNAQVVAVSGSNVNVDVEACTDILGGAYNADTTLTKTPSTLPNPTTVFDYYTANGTSISYSSLRQGDRELLTNGDFELDMSGWYAVNGCTLQLNLGVLMLKQGLMSLRVTNRDSVTDAVATDIDVADVVSGHSYGILCPVYSAGAATMRLTLIVTTDQGTYTRSTTATAVPANTWTDLTGAIPASSWPGTVLQATLQVESSTVNRDFYIDGVSFKDTTYGSAYLLEDKLLAPGLNPFGAGNSKGIYLINCGGRDVVVLNSRIIGTLVMLNPGPGSTLRGTLCMEPAEAHMPAFMANAPVSIGLASGTLRENRKGVNYNPPGRPYPYQGGNGTFTNLTATDAYPSAINGLVYCKDDLLIENNTTINGVVVGNAAIQITSPLTTLRYNNYYLNNPPPGFTAGTITMKPVAGTWQRVVN